MGKPAKPEGIRPGYRARCARKAANAPFNKCAERDVNREAADSTLVSTRYPDNIMQFKRA